MFVNIIDNTILITKKKNFINKIRWIFRYIDFISIENNVIYEIIIINNIGCIFRYI